MDWGGLATSIASIGSTVNQSLAQAGVYGQSAQQVALTRPLAPPAVQGGATAYTATVLSSPALILAGIAAVLVFGIIFVFRK